MSTEKTKKDVIIIPRIQKFFKQKKVSVKKNTYNYFLTLIFVLYLFLLVIITFLPIANSLRILALLIGSFILEDLHHSFKKLCQQ